MPVDGIEVRTALPRDRAQSAERPGLPCEVFEVIEQDPASLDVPLCSVVVTFQEGQAAKNTKCLGPRQQPLVVIAREPAVRGQRALGPGAALGVPPSQVTPAPDNADQA